MRYDEYKQEHPEELVNVERLFERSGHYDNVRKARQKRKLKKIEECRRILYGEEHSK